MVAKNSDLLIQSNVLFREFCPSLSVEMLIRNTVQEMLIRNTVVEQFFVAWNVVILLVDVRAFQYYIK